MDELQYTAMQIVEGSDERLTRSEIIQGCHDTLIDFAYRYFAADNVFPDNNTLGLVRRLVISAMLAQYDYDQDFWRDVTRKDDLAERRHR